MATKYHDLEVEGSIHIPNDLTYANQAARLAAGGLAVRHVGRLAKQTDDNSYWVLTNHSPVTWAPYTAPAPVIGDVGKVLKVEDDGAGNPRTTWDDESGAVVSVAGKTGVVTLEAADVTDFDVEVANNTTVAANAVHAAGSGSDHANVATNTTHSTGDGSDHADVAANTAHAGQTDNPHTVTKAQVSLSNVTDDAQLKRAAGDIGTFVEKVTPVSGDVILIEDSAAAGAKKKIQVGNLPTGGGGEANTSSNTGLGAGLAKSKVGIDLPFKSLTEGTAIALTENVDDVEVAVDDTAVRHDYTSGIQGGLGPGNIYHLTPVEYSQLLTGVNTAVHYHNADRDRANHTGTQAAATISDFDTEVGNQTDVAANTTARHDRQHALGDGADHTSATLAALNLLVSDATLDDSSDPRDPNAHAASHEGGADAVDVASLTSATGSSSDVLTKGAGTAVSWQPAGAPAAHNFGGSSHLADTLANVNSKISDATLDDSSSSRTPTAHAASHEAGADGVDPALQVSATGTNGQVLTKGVGTAVSWEDASGGTPAHNDTTGIQGGTATERYHLTSAQHTDLTDAGDSTLHYHATDRARANHTGTQVAATISDFDTEVENNIQVAANIGHRSNNGNPHGTDIENLGSGTLAELNAAITDATLDDSSDSRTPSAHASSHEGGADAVDVASLTSASGTNTQVLTKGVGTAVAWQDAGGGASTFTDLTDTPSAYTGQGGKVVAVNTGATALEFVVAPWAPTVTEVTGATYTVTGTEKALDLNRVGVIAVTLDNDAKVDGFELHIADAGDNSTTYNHTVTPETGTIMGETFMEFTADGMSVTVYWSASASEWRVR